MKVVHTTYGPDLLTHSGQLFEYSSNLLGEILWMHTAQKAGKKIQTWDEARSYWQKWIKKHFGDMNWQQINGSGLSEDNKASAKAVTTLIKTMYQENNHFDLAPILPVSGFTGSIKKRFTNYPGLILAKTGTMNFIHSLAGIIFVSGIPHAFSLVVNDEEGRQRITAARKKNNMEELQKTLNEAKAFQAEAILFQEWWVAKLHEFYQKKR